jgi:hypothetical protein
MIYRALFIFILQAIDYQLLIKIFTINLAHLLTYINHLNRATYGL